MITLNKKNDLTKYALYIFLFILISLPSGPLLPEIGILLIFFLFFKIKSDIKIDSDLKKIIFFFLAFYISINFSNVFIDQNFFQSYKVSIFYLRFLFYLIVVRELVISECFKTNMTFVFIFFFVFIIIDGIIQFYLGSNIFGIQSEGLKISGIFGNEQIMGSFIVKLLPLALFFVYNSKIDDLKKKKLIILLIFLSLIGVIISNEFNSIILFLFFISFFSLILFKLNIKLLILIITLTLIFFQTNNFEQQKLRLFSVYNNVMVQKNSTIKDSYFSIIKTSILIWNQNKIFGSGVKSYKNLSKKKKFQVSIYSQQNHSHNYYFQLLSETGILGLSFLIYLLYYVSKIFILTYFKLLKKFSFSKNLDISILLVSSGLLINIFPFVPSGNFFNNWLSIIIFSYLGVLLGVTKLKEISK